MAKSPFMRQLKRAASIAGESARRNVPVEQVVEEKVQESITRRDFLKKAALASAVLAVPPSLFNFGAKLVNAATAPRVAVVGAGLAGLTAAYRLKQAGIQAQVYEASTRVGGRCFTNRTSFANGQTSEHGGELVNSQDTELLGLIGELQLQVDDLWALEVGDFRVILDGSIPTSLATEFKTIYNQLQKDVQDAGSDTFYYQYTSRGYQLDNMSIKDWINLNVPRGMNSMLGKSIDLSWTSSAGLESSQLSALWMLYAMSTASKDEYTPFGVGHDERYHIHGGNDQVPKGLANKLSGQIMTSAPLQALKKNNDGTYTLCFSGSQPSVTADYVILALPVSTLRDVDLSKAGFRSLKLKGIAELGVSTNSKLAMQFTEPYWHSLGSDGEIVSNTGYQVVWDSTVGQSGSTAILTNFTGGDLGYSFGAGDAQYNVSRMLPLIERDMPGLTAKYTGVAALDYWPGYKWAKGSYSCYKAGQMTKFRGVFGEAEGNCFFAGEYTSLQNQQFMNGAVETGQRAAREVLAKLGVTVAHR
ncbi:flavin monoamine oxidase family protein [Paenibacillus sp. GCM10027628]|uniref:flavin monoamine oxidase family protein n=1 Tax=Paenibacillus sp. GCM10027628 TaxID=3273413 RepID=UPI00362BF988